MKNIAALHLRLFGSTILILAAGVMLTGCIHLHSPLPQRFDASGIPHSFKRAEQYPQRDYVHHFVRQAYIRPDRGLRMFQPCGDSQINIVKEWGRPDWLRKPFRSLENERVEEWLYLDQQRVFQFIGPDLVYDGPLTEYEQVLLARGYPNNANFAIRENGEREDLFIYEKLYTPWLEQFKFRDGHIVQSQEGF